MICKNCKKEISNDSLFCENCGCSIDGSCSENKLNPIVFNDKNFNEEESHNKHKKKIIKSVIITLFLTVILLILALCTHTKYTKGLDFELSEERTSYLVVGVGTAKGSKNGRFDIVIPKNYDDLPVKGIKAGAFRNCTGITSITLPDGIEIIEDNAFYACQNLESLYIPNSVQDIGEMAFYGCEKLCDITIPEKLSQIKYGTFWNCYNLKKIIIPVSVKHIEECAFLCAGLESLTIADASITIEAGAFDCCDSLTNVDIVNWAEGSESNISRDAFSMCINLKKISVPSGYIDINNDEDSDMDTVTYDRWVDIAGNINGFINDLDVIYITLGEDAEFYLSLATYRGGHDATGQLTKMEDGTLFFFDGFSRSFTLRIVDNDSIELIGDTQKMADGIYKSLDSTNEPTSSYNINWANMIGCRYYSEDANMYIWLETSEEKVFVYAETGGTYSMHYKSSNEIIEVSDNEIYCNDVCYGNISIKFIDRNTMIVETPSDSATDTFGQGSYKIAGVYKLCVG